MSQLCSGSVQERSGRGADNPASEEGNPSAVPSQTPPHNQTVLLLPGLGAHLHCAGVCQEWRALQVLEAAKNIHYSANSQGSLVNLFIEHCNVFMA